MERDLLFALIATAAAIGVVVWLAWPQQAASFSTSIEGTLP